MRRNQDLVLRYVVLVVASMAMAASAMLIAAIFLHPGSVGAPIAVGVVGFAIGMGGAMIVQRRMARPPLGVPPDVAQTGRTMVADTGAKLPEEDLARLGFAGQLVFTAWAIIWCRRLSAVLTNLRDELRRERSEGPDAPSLRYLAEASSTAFRAHLSAIAFAGAWEMGPELQQIRAQAKELCVAFERDVCAVLAGSADEGTHGLDHARQGCEVIIAKLEGIAAELTRDRNRLVRDLVRFLDEHSYIDKCE